MPKDDASDKRIGVLEGYKKVTKDHEEIEFDRLIGKVCPGTC